MRKILRPKHNFSVKPFNLPVSTLADLQNQVFQNQNFSLIQREIEIANSETRLQIVYVLAIKDSLCVSDLAQILRLEISSVSHQLSLLRQAGWVAYKKKGRLVYYSLAERLPTLLTTILSQAQS